MICLQASQEPDNVLTAAVYVDQVVGQFPKESDRHRPPESL